MQDIPIVFITGHGDIPMAVEAMRRGAVDFLRKPFRDQELLDRIQEALSAGCPAPRRGGGCGFSARPRGGAHAAGTGGVQARCFRPKPTRSIAIELGISERTVEIHRSNVMQKTGSRSLADLVRLLIKFEEAERAEAD